MQATTTTTDRIATDRPLTRLPSGSFTFTELLGQFNRSLPRCFESRCATKSPASARSGGSSARVRQTTRTGSTRTGSRSTGSSGASPVRRTAPSTRRSTRTTSIWSTRRPARKCPARRSNSRSTDRGETHRLTTNYGGLTRGRVAWGTIRTDAPAPVRGIPFQGPMTGKNTTHRKPDESPADDQTARSTGGASA